MTSDWFTGDQNADRSFTARGLCHGTDILHSAIHCIAYNSRAVSGGAAGEREAISNMMAAGDMFISVMGDFAFTGKQIIRIAVLV